MEVLRQERECKLAPLQAKCPEQFLIIPFSFKCIAEHCSKVIKLQRLEPNYPLIPEVERVLR